MLLFRSRGSRGSRISRVSRDSRGSRISRGSRTSRGSRGSRGSRSRGSLGSRSRGSLGSRGAFRAFGSSIGNGTHFDLPSPLRLFRLLMVVELFETWPFGIKPFGADDVIELFELIVFVS